VAGGIRQAAGRSLDAVDRGIVRVLRWRTPREAPWSGVRLALMWIVTRAVALDLMIPWLGLSNDLSYYQKSITGGSALIPAGLHEYPLPALWLVSVPEAVAHGNPVTYKFVFIGMLLAVDIAFTWALHRWATDPHSTTLWLAAGPCVGPLLFLRFDLVTGAAAGVSLLVLLTRPRLAGALAAIATALKLWPLLLLPLLAAPRAGRRRFAVGVLVVGGVLLVPTLAVGGIDRLVSPLRFQSARGLHIESLAALPLMFSWSLAHEPWEVRFSDTSFSQELHGPGVTAILVLSTVATVAVAVLVLLLAVRLWHRGGAGVVEVGWAVVASCSMLVVVNKVFSPQYLLWLVPLGVALVGVSDSRTSRRVATLLLLAGVAGQLVYPVTYNWIISPSGLSVVGVLLLSMRDVFVLAVAVVAAREAWRRSAPVPVASPAAVA